MTNPLRNVLSPNGGNNTPVGHASGDNRVPQIAVLGSPLESKNPGKSVAFISDLHLYSTRCDYARHKASIERAVEAADICVWGGDLFDFCWSSMHDPSQSRAMAIEWLETWRSRFPQKVFVYLIGNHDAQPEFLSDLTQWSANRTSPLPNGVPNVQDALPIQANQTEPSRLREPVHLSDSVGQVHVGWDAIRIDDTILVHGDVIESVGCHVGLVKYRSRWQHERSGGPPPVRNRIYDTAVNARLHLAAARVAHRRRSVCLRLMRWTKSQPNWFHSGTKRIVFGHTHRRMCGATIGGIEFHNAGAAVRHVPFTPVLLRIGTAELP